MAELDVIPGNLEPEGKPGGPSGRKRARVTASALAVLRSLGPHGFPSGFGLSGKPSGYHNPSSHPHLEAIMNGDIARDWGGQEKAE